MSITVRIPQCLSCKWWHSPLDQPESDAEMAMQTCQAYPGGIPDQIWTGKADHRQPYKGDHDKQWTPRDERALFPERALRTNRLT